MPQNAYPVYVLQKKQISECIDLLSSLQLEVWLTYFFQRQFPNKILWLSSCIMVVVLHKEINFSLLQDMFCKSFSTIKNGCGIFLPTALISPSLVELAFSLRRVMVSPRISFIDNIRSNSLSRSCLTSTDMRESRPRLPSVLSLLTDDISLTPEIPFIKSHES